MYRFATRAVPWGLSWLLNALSYRQFVPKGFKETVEQRIQITGQVEALRRLTEKGTVLLVPTHQSNLDSPLIGFVIYLMGLPPFCYGAGLNLFTNPILNLFMGRLGAYTVDRKKSNEIYKLSLKNYSTRILSEGMHSVFFPGGGRSRSGAIESKLKLGLLGTALQAQVHSYLEAKARGGAAGERSALSAQGEYGAHGAKKIFIVPMVTSYHFVLEASSLIEDYLLEAGRSRFLPTDEELWQPVKIVGFIKKLLSQQTSLSIRIGQPMDVFGNPVVTDVGSGAELGQSIGTQGLPIDPRDWLTSKGELIGNEQRDNEYTRLLGKRVVDRFYRDNTVISSHVVAFAFFEALRAHYPELDLFRFLRLSGSQRVVGRDEFMQAVKKLRDTLLTREEQRELNVSAELRDRSDEGTDRWIRDGIRQLGLMHDRAVLQVDDGVVRTTDLALLYYYRNRLSGYGLSMRRDDLTANVRTSNDAKGFLV
jgi:glycerol-3-phosphate O-acyltransferase